MTVGNTKAWIDTKTNGQKELSLAGHTHSYADSTHKHSADNITSGILGITRGGTGKTSWAANRLVYYGTTTLGQVAFPSVAGSVLRQGTSGAPYWTSLADLKTAIDAAPVDHTHTAGDITSGTLPVARGGTGVTSLDELATIFSSTKIEIGTMTATKITASFIPKFIIFICGKITGYSSSNGILGIICGTDGIGWSFTSNGSEMEELSASCTVDETTESVTVTIESGGSRLNKSGDTGYPKYYIIVG